MAYFWHLSVDFMSQRAWFINYYFEELQVAYCFFWYTSVVYKTFIRRIYSKLILHSFYIAFKTLYAPYFFYYDVGITYNNHYYKFTIKLVGQFHLCWGWENATFYLSLWFISENIYSYRLLYFIKNSGENAGLSTKRINAAIVKAYV